MLLPVTCRYLQEGRCSIVLQRTGIEWSAHPLACEDCAKQTPPQRWNKVTIGLSIAALRTAKDPRYDTLVKQWLPQLKQFIDNAKTTEKTASLPKQLSNYAKAIARWTTAGQPKRTDEEVASILMICKACSYFTGKSCMVCGCRINVSKRAAFNKARMSTENCPKGKW